MSKIKYTISDEIIPAKSSRDRSLQDSFRKSSHQIHRSKNINKNSDIHKTRAHGEKRKIGWISILLLIIILFCLLIGIIYMILSPANKSFNLNPFNFVVKQVLGQQQTLIQNDGRINMLIIGVDNRSDTLTNDLKQVGNTDTILISSYDIKSSSLQFISIPRDFGIRFKFPDGYTDNYYKINAGVNLGANQKYPGGGVQLLKDALLSMTGLKINYTAIVNFDAFTQIIDSLGGIDVNIENSFCDAGYPKPGDNGVMTIKFNKGPAHLDGTKALQFARSRVHDECYNMSAGTPVFEGNDFRRAYRQQQVIAATKEKLNTLGSDFGKIQSIISAIGKNVLTQMGDGELTDNNKFDLQTLKEAFDLKDKIKSTNSFVLDPSICGGNLLKETTLSDQYFLLPKQTSFAPIRACIASYLNNPDLTSENAQVGVYNNGLGYSQSSELATQINTDGFSATFYENISLKKFYNWTPATPTLNPAQGLYVIDLNGNKPKTLEALVNKYHATVIQKSNLPSSIQSLGGVDILMIAGGNLTPTP